jgi:hypothetical protein
VADKEVTAGDQVVRQLPDDVSLGLPVEVDHDVAAEDDGVTVGQGVVVVHQVELAEADAGAEFGGDAEGRRGGGRAGAKEVGAPPSFGERSDGGLAVGSLAGLGEYLRGDVGAEDREIEGALGAAPLGEHHAQGIGLFAGGSGRAPDPQRLAAAEARGVESGQDCFFEEGKVGRFPEEVRFVGG